MSSLLKNLLIALGIAILLWVGYMTFIREDGGASLGTSLGPISEQAELEAQRLLLDISKLKSYNVNGAIFDDVRFSTLYSFRIDIPPERVGRTNPFAPVE